MILRDFLFLDTQLLGDYLSTLEGYVVEGHIDQTEVGKKETGGNLNIKAISANRTAADSTETKKKLAVTDAARFQHLYNLLSESDAIQYLDAFDLGIWKQLRRGEILEVQAKIQLPKSLLMMRDIENVSPFLDVMKALGQDLLQDDESRTAFEGMRAVGKLAENQPIPLVFEAASSPKFSFVAYLPKNYIRRELNDFQGEAVVLGKIQRILQKNERVEVFSLVPALTQSATVNRQQRRKMAKGATGNNITDEVGGPAIILTPIAVYR